MSYTYQQVLDEVNCLSDEELTKIVLMGGTFGIDIECEIPPAFRNILRNHLDWFLLFIHLNGKMYRPVISPVRGCKRSRRLYAKGQVSMMVRAGLTEDQARQLYNSKHPYRQELAPYLAQMYRNPAIVEVIKKMTTATPRHKVEHLFPGLPLLLRKKYLALKNYWNTTHAQT